MTDPKRNFSRTLSTRLSLAFIAVVALVGISVLLVNQSLMRVYFEEFNQKLNASIAMYITQRHQLIRSDNDAPDLAVIHQLADTAMMVNPAAEVYVLDPSGKIIGHNFPPESVQVEKVPLEPVLELIGGSDKFPIRNINPRDAITTTVFSAAEIREGDNLQGYLYVVLGGDVYKNLEDNLWTSYSRTQNVIAVAFIVIAAIISGWIIFHLMVRPLGRLSERMRRFSVDALTGDSTPPPESEEPAFRDEIALLSRRFDEMRTTITRQVEQLIDTDRLKRELISNVSHDLRTPLASIQGYLETLLIKNESLSDKERLNYLSTAMKSSRRLSQLVGDLFELSKLESGQMQPELEQFSLAELVFDIVQEFNLEFKAKNIDVTINNNQNNALVYADISMIQRVFENLIRNAITHTPENGKITLSIDSDQRSVQDRLKIAITDTGCGIPQQDLPHIFERFFASSMDKGRDSSSTGLGLAIVKRILDLHQANINVESEVNQGTRFEFSLLRHAA